MATVRTPEGSTRFGKPIGSALGEKSMLDATPEAPAVSSVRLRSLRAMIMQKKEIGDEGAVRALTEKFRAEYAIFSAGKTPEQAEQELNGTT